MSWFDQIKKLELLLLDNNFLSKEEFEELHRLIESLAVIDVKRKLNDFSYKEYYSPERLDRTLESVNLLTRIIDDFMVRYRADLIKLTTGDYTNDNQITSLKSKSNAVALLCEIIFVLSKGHYELDSELSFLLDIAFEYAIISAELYLLSDNINLAKHICHECVKLPSTNHQYFHFFYSLIQTKDKPEVYLSRLSNKLHQDDNTKLFENALRYIYETTNIRKFAGSYFSEEILSQLDRYCEVLWPSQFRIDEILSPIYWGRTLRAIISLPTSAGKTVYAELAILLYLIENPEKKCFYVAPTKELVNELKQKFENRLSKITQKVEVANTYVSIYFDGYFEEEINIIKKSNLIILTPEKFTQILIKGETELISSIGLIIFDEIQNVGEFNDRSILEELLISLIKQKKLLTTTSIIGLSAVCSNSTELVSWLSSNLEGQIDRNLVSIEIAESWRPTRQICIYSNSQKNRVLFVSLGNYRNSEKQNSHVVESLSKEELDVYLPEDPVERIIQVVKHTYGNLVFLYNKSHIPSLCKKIIKKLNGEFEETDSNNNLIELIDKLDLTHKDSIKRCFKYRVGIFHSDLPKYLKKLILKAFKDKCLHTLIVSPSLSEGVNIPFEKAIFHGLHLQKALEYSKFINTAGRVGRAGISSDGIILFSAKPDMTYPDGFYLAKEDKYRLEPHYVWDKKKKKSKLHVNTSLYYINNIPEKMRVNSSVEKVATLPNEEYIDILEKILLEIISDYINDNNNPDYSKEILDKLISELIDGTLVSSQKLKITLEKRLK